VIQARDGSLHVTYSYFVAEGKSIKHARFQRGLDKSRRLARKDAVSPHFIPYFIHFAPDEFLFSEFRTPGIATFR
jgi:hypothetical protein